ncbi:MAG: hypothetical protein WCJ64_04585 [Rhodospirillaceae bacterium]
MHAISSTPPAAPAPWRSLGEVLAGISAADAWGPFADGIDDAERLARLRSLRALALVHCGPHGDVLRVALRAAETKPEALAIALEAINGLPAVPRRHLLASYAALDREGRGHG